MKENKIKEILKKQLELPISVRAVDEENDGHTLSFIGSDETVDRYGDIVKVDGWDVKNYNANPVFLWAHNSRQMPIGKAEKVWVEDGKLKFKIKFAVEEYPFAKLAYDMYKGGYLNATSVGFMVKDWKFADDNFVSLEQELLELSAVPVPANPSALRLGLTDEEHTALKEFHTEKQKTLASKTMDTKPEIEKAVQEHNEPFVDEPKEETPIPTEETVVKENIEEDKPVNEKEFIELKELVTSLSTQLKELTDIIREKLINPEQSNDTIVEQPVDEPAEVVEDAGEQNEKTVDEEPQGDETVTTVEDKPTTEEVEKTVEETEETEVVEQPEEKNKTFSISVEDIRETLKAK